MLLKISNKFTLLYFNLIQISIKHTFLYLIQISNKHT